MKFHGKYLALGTNLRHCFETTAVPCAMQKVFMVLELCKGGELSKVWKKKGCFMEEVRE